jgi:catechol 2,3-dioxygenase-like lactoylglutathione lyase family enzyme
MIKALRHVGLVVNDLNSSLNFWRDIMGFKVIRQLEEKGKNIDKVLGLKNVDVTTIKLSAPDGNVLELLRFNSHRSSSNWSGSPYSTGLTHIALTVQDMERTCQRLKKAGVTFPAEPQLSADGNVKVIYATGPEGVLIELVEVVS